MTENTRKREIIFCSKIASENFPLNFETLNWNIYPLSPLKQIQV